jgi:GxxExxY protein
MDELTKALDPSLRDGRTYAIIGAAMEVHRVLGSGFLEAVYQEALAIEFSQRGISFVEQPNITVSYKGQLLNSVFRADFVCFDCVLVEIKALNRLSGSEENQILNYLKASNLEVALLLNFGVSSLFHRRFARTSSKSAQSA